MSKKIGVFLLIGFVWLFLFSIPVGHGKRLFDIAAHYIVSSQPVLWLMGQIDETVAKTDETPLRNNGQNWMDSGRDKLSQSDRLYDYSE